MRVDRQTERHAHYNILSEVTSVVAYEITSVLMNEWIGAVCHLFQCFCHNRRWHVVRMTFGKIERFIRTTNQLGDSKPLHSTLLHCIACFTPI